MQLSLKFGVGALMVNMMIYIASQYDASILYIYQVGKILPDRSRNGIDYKQNLHKRKETKPDHKSLCQLGRCFYISNVHIIPKNVPPTDTLYAKHAFPTSGLIFFV